MSADNGLLVRKNRNGCIVVQHYFASAERYPKIEDAKPQEIYPNLEKALENNQELARETEYGFQIQI